MRVADVLRSSVTLSSLNGDFGQFINTLARIVSGGMPIPFTLLCNEP